MRKIKIDTTPHQEILINFEGGLVKIILMFRQSKWFMTVYFDSDIVVAGIKLSCSVMMLSGKNLAFDFVIDSNDNNLDPFALDSFDSGAFDFYILEREETEEVRGFEVE